MCPSSVEPRPAGAVPSQGQPCPVAPRPGHPLPSPCSHPESRSPLRDPRIPPPIRARCRGEPAFDAGEGGGTGGIEQRRAGHQEVGAENPRRESRGRAALPGFPRGLGRAQEERRAAAQGGRAAREVAGARPLSQIRVRRAFGGLWLAGCVGSAHPRAVPGTRVSVRACMGALCLAPRPQVSGCPCRWQGWGLLPWAAGGPAAAAGGGVTGVWFVSPRTGARQEGLRLAAAALLWATVGGGWLRCRETRLLAREGKCTALSQVGKFLGI